MRSKLYLLGAEVYESIHRVQRMSNQFLDLLELSAFVTAKFVRLLLQVPGLQNRGYVPSSSCFFTYLLSFLKYRFITEGFSLFPRPDSNPFLRVQNHQKRERLARSGRDVVVMEQIKLRTTSMFEQISHI